MDHVHPLRAFRDSHSPRLTQGALAKVLGVSRETVARWETGARDIDIDRLPDIERATGIPAAVLRPELAAMFVEPSE